MITKDEAIALIEARLQKQERVIVALDGMSCSGKSTFAAALAERFSGSVVHMDDFFLPRDQFTEEMQALPGGNMDRDRFRAEVLLPLAAGEDFAYRAFSFLEEIREVEKKGNVLLVCHGGIARVINSYFIDEVDNDGFIDNICPNGGVRKYEYSDRYIAPVMEIPDELK